MSRLQLTDFVHALGLGRSTAPPTTPPPAAASPAGATALPGTASAAAPPMSPAGAAVFVAAATGPATASAAKPERRHVTLQYCVESALRADFNRTRDTLFLGRLATLWVATQVDRAAAILELRHAYELAGLAGEILNVNRQIAAWQLHQLFDGELVAGFGVSVIRALLPLVKRDSKTGQWTIRPGVESQAREIVARTAAERWTAAQAHQEVAKLFPPQKRRNKKQARRIGRIQREIRHLEPEELDELRNWLQALSRNAAA